MAPIAAKTWRRLAGVGIILFVTAAVLPEAAQGIFVVLVGVLAVAAVYFRTCRRLEDPRPWQWFVLAGLLFVVGNAILAGWKIVSGVPAPFPSIADPFFLGGYVTLLTGEVLLVRRRSSDSERDNLIDALMITAVVGVFLWAFLLGPAVQASQVATDQRALEVVYSLFDLLAIAGATRVAVGSGKRLPSYYFLAAALGCVLLADTLISLQAGGSDRAIPVSAISCLTFVLFALAGLHPSVARLTDPPAPREIQLTARRLAVLCAAFLVIPLGFVVGLPLGARFDLPILVVGSVALGLLAVARMAGLVHAKERKANRERLLREAGQALVMSTDRDQLYYVAAVSAATLAQITGSGACVSSATYQSGKLAFGSWFGLDEDVADSVSVTVADLPAPASHAVLSGESYLVEPALASIVAGKLGLSPTRFASLLLVPLKAREHPRGVLAVASPRTIGLELRQSVELLAGHVTLALEGAALAEEIARRRSERRFRALVEQSSDLVIVVGTDGRISFVSPAIRTMLGVPEEEVLGQSPLGRVHPDDQAQARALLDRTWASAAVTDRTELRLRLGDGRYGWFELHAQNLAEEEEIGGAVIHAREVTDRKVAELRLSDSEARFRSLVQHAGDVVMVVDDSLQFSYLSPSVFRLLGYRSDELTGSALGKLFHVNDARQAVRLISMGRSKEREGPIELRMRHASGRWISVETTITDLRHDPAVRGIVLNGRDIADRKALEHELRYKALHDLLTGLANRSLFIERLAATLKHLDATTRAAVIFIDLDDFKTVNDGMGHLLGDAVLIEVAHRLRRCTRPGDLAARLGGDEFAVLVEGVAGRREAKRLAERILAALSEPVTLEGRELRMGASIGVALTGATQEEDGVKGLLRDADQAMYGAKLRGKGQLQLFDPQMRNETSTRLVLTNDLATAVKRGEVFAHYQPIVDLQTGRLIGAEALARWRHPTEGLVPPDVFIPMAEHTGVIMAVGQLVIEKACATLGEYKRVHPDRPFRMSINLSIRQLEHPDLSKQVARVLRRHKVDPGDVTLELTESLSPVDVELATRRMGELKAMGVRLAIDDFGVGYSSLACLEQFPVDELKIDRSFISSLESGGDAHIVTSIIGLAKARSLTTVAEGVETCGGARALADLGCDLAQGFYFSTPLDPVEFSRVPSRIWQDPERETVGV